jgi:hypothetical protein
MHGCWVGHVSSYRISCMVEVLYRSILRKYLQGLGIDSCSFQGWGILASLRLLTLWNPSPSPIGSLRWEGEEMKSNVGCCSSLYSIFLSINLSNMIRYCIPCFNARRDRMPCMQWLPIVRRNELGRELDCHCSGDLAGWILHHGLSTIQIDDRQE